MPESKDGAIVALVADIKVHGRHHSIIVAEIAVKNSDKKSTKVLIDVSVVVYQDGNQVPHGRNVAARRQPCHGGDVIGRRAGRRMGVVRGGSRSG